MSTVIVAEKPSVAREIAGVLGAGVKRDGYLQTKDGKRIVTWAFGHLVRYAKPDEYGEAWSGKWDMGHLPMVPDTWLLKVAEESSAQFRTVSELMNRAERVICATDAGREGEHIFRLIYQRSCCTAPVQRLWVSSLTKEALRAGFENLQPEANFDKLADAAQARDKADWLVGFNLTRAYSVKHGTTCSVGRVQTPTLALVVERDRQIDTFTRSHYYEVVAHLAPGFDAVHVRPGEPDDKGRAPWVRRIDSRAEADAITTAAGNRAATVDDVDTRTVRRRPPALFDLTTLQREANERLGWTAAQTLEAAQSLYEARVITYPRTECRYLPEDMRPQLGELLESTPHPHAALALDHLKRGRGKEPGKGTIDSTKLTDHHAIIPTKEPIPASIAQDGRLGQLYALIVSRFVSIFFPDELTEETTVRLDIGGQVFLASGRRRVQEGWRVVVPAGREDGDGGTGDVQLPALRSRQTVEVSSLEVVEKETGPPKRYTDATLLAAMKNAGRTLDDESQADVLKEAGGLGTPATRAAVIEGLVKRGYVVRKGKTLLSTDKGRALVGVVSEPLRSAELTAQWERELREVEQGNGTAAGFLAGITALVRELLPLVQSSSGRVPGGSNGHARPVGPCPSCGQGVVERGKAFGCSAWRETGCGFKVWKVMSGKKLTVTQVKALLKKGHTGLIKGFKSRAGKPFEAVLKLDAQNGVVFDFGDG